MKFTKKALKDLFGDQSEALDYLKQLYDGKPAPVLFAHGSQSNSWGSWLASLVPGAVVTDRATFVRDAAKMTAKLIIVQNATAVDSPLVTACTSSRKAGRNVVVTTPVSPKMLEMVNDPTLLIIKAEAFDAIALNGELDELKGELA